MSNEPQSLIENARVDAAGHSQGQDEWETAIEVLEVLLAENAGCVSSLALRKMLERKGIGEARELVRRLRFFDPSDSSVGPRPGFLFHHSGKRFYTDEKYQELCRVRDQAAEDASQKEDFPADPDAEVGSERRTNRREEARLVTYVADALEEIYSTEFSPEDRKVAYDIHSTRAGSDYENVDLLAVHWRSRSHVDLVTVEVKLQFSAQLVQQATNYRRFSDRVWIAVPVEADLVEAATELREADPRLFDHVIQQGIGILACRRTYGRSYTVLPVHWPRKLELDPLERHEFVERHRACLEEAGVIAPRHTDRYPRIG